MPVYQSDAFGKLYVSYHIIFPAVVDDQFVKDLELTFQSRKKRLQAAGSTKDEL
jgi:hypothetical protein